MLIEELFLIPDPVEVDGETRQGTVRVIFEDGSVLDIPDVRRSLYWLWRRTGCDDIYMPLRLKHCEELWDKVAEPFGDDFDNAGNLRDVPTVLGLMSEQEFEKYERLGFKIARL